jgi:hypothetical protein
MDIYLVTKKIRKHENNRFAKPTGKISKFISCNIAVQPELASV